MKFDEPRPQYGTEKSQQEKILIEEIMMQQDSGREEEEEKMYQEVGPSSAPGKGKGKQLVLESSCKKPEVTMVLPCIPA
jgi:hypothetical protein